MTKRNTLCSLALEHGKVLEGPVLRFSVADVLLPTLTTWEWPVRKSRIQLQRKVFHSRVLSLVNVLGGHSGVER
jgi:hypothetical protein